jgi:hypothetical protein
MNESVDQSTDDRVLAQYHDFPLPLRHRNLHGLCMFRDRSSDQAFPPLSSAYVFEPIHTKILSSYFPQTSNYCYFQSIPFAFLHSNNMTQSRSIPITGNSKAARDEADQQRDEMVDFQDYLFYSRIVDGMKKRQAKTRCIDLRYQNQALIDHITYTRKADLSASQMMHHASTLGGSFQNSQGLISNCVSVTLSLVNDDQEDMMFEMEI